MSQAGKSPNPDDDGSPKSDGLDAGGPDQTIDRTIPGLPVQEAKPERQPGALPSALEPLGPIGRHPWEPVPNVDLPFLPYCTVCSLKALTADGRAYAYGSGVMIGRRTVLTARHCLFIEDVEHVGRAQWVEVTPGRGFSGGDVLPFTTVRSDDFHRDPDHDFAVIFLDQEPRDTKAEGSLPLRARMRYAYYPDVPTGQVIVHNLGYPGVHPATAKVSPKYKSMWKGIGEVLSAGRDSLDYDIDTTEGNSGSPVFLRLTNGNPKEDEYHVIGIHVEDHSRRGFNRAVRISTHVCDRLDGWRGDNGDTI